ncbi:MAG: hypothetical protein GWO04_21445, partial [Actinobacteria bacterium]|nr:hypothetical protein [Actinomycetota bacterium]NIW29167.1 hypothetical protein [Actinomycetota bacterium]
RLTGGGAGLAPGVLATLASLAAEGVPAGPVGRRLELTRVVARSLGSPPAKSLRRVDPRFRRFLYREHGPREIHRREARLTR